MTTNKRVVCDAEHPWDGTTLPVCHPDAVSCGSQESGWPSGDIQPMHCPHCNKRFEVELEQ